MSPRDDYEDEIEAFRKNRRLIHIQNLNFRRTRKQLETAIKSHIPAPDQAKFFWPPPADGNKHKGDGRHDGWVMLGFDSRRDCGAALDSLKDKKLVIFSRTIAVARAHPVYYGPGSDGKRRARTDRSVPSQTAAQSTPAIPAAGNVAPDSSMFNQTESNFEIDSDYDIL